MAEAERGFWSQRGMKPWLFESLAENAARVCGDSDAIIFLKRNGALRHVAHYGSILTATKKGEPGPPIDDRRSVAGRAFVDGQTVHVHDVQAADEFPLTKAKGIAHGVRTSLAMPLLRKGVPMGVILMRRTEVRPFSEQEIAWLKTFVDQAAIAFEHGQLFREIDARNHDLAEALAQQTATSEILRVIASSPTDLQPVLNAVAENAARICEANDALIYRFDGCRIEGVTNYGPLPGNIGMRLRTVDSHTIPGRAVTERQTVHVHDLFAVPESELRARCLRQHNTRTVLATPLLRQGNPIGVIMIRRMEVQPFSDRQIAMLETFADQAVIAIENVRLFQEIQEKNEQLETASRYKSQFLANMSHELRTPLNGILGLTEMILDKIYGEVPEKVRSALEDVQASGRHLLNLINDVLDLSKIEAGRATLSLQEYSMREIVQAVFTAMQPLAAAKNLALKIAVPTDLPPGKGDQRRITQVLLNLVGNAIKFTESGEVRVEVGSADGSFLVSVSDTGPGIAPADRERIFEEFQQVDGSSSRAKGGTGLGLAIAKRIIEMHGGRIWVESKVGAGSTFIFSLPVRVPHQAEAS